MYVCMYILYYVYVYCICLYDRSEPDLGFELFDVNPSTSVVQCLGAIGSGELHNLITIHTYIHTYMMVTYIYIKS